jgi:phospholipid/cholesterol/gamma-HCH transport system substrate-binding protein
MAVRTEVRVGMFVFLGLAIIGGLIFIIGDTRRMFDTKVGYYTEFSDVTGLIPGAMVQMGGVNVGEVRSVHFPDDPKLATIRVEFAVVRSEAIRIRKDSVASVAPKGLLGDKLVAITIGASDQPSVPEGSGIPSIVDPGIMGSISKLGSKAESVLVNLEQTTQTFAEEDFRSALKDSAQSVRGILAAVERGPGYVPKLLNDPAEAERLSQTISHLERATARLEVVMRGAEQTVRQVNEGPGSAHDLLYGKQATVATEQLGKAAEEFALTLSGIRNGDGLAHDLLFGGPGAESPKIAKDLAAISGDLRQMSAQLREGKGTLGALLTDPSVYEDLKVLLGNVQRNEVLRAFVRYSIQKDETAPKVEVKP